MLNLSTTKEIVKLAKQVKRIEKIIEQEYLWLNLKESTFCICKPKEASVFLPHLMKRIIPFIKKIENGSRTTL